MSSTKYPGRRARPASPAPCSADVNDDRYIALRHIRACEAAYRSTGERGDSLFLHHGPLHPILQRLIAEPRLVDGFASGFASGMLREGPTLKLMAAEAPEAAQQVFEVPSLGGDQQHRGASI